MSDSLRQPCFSFDLDGTLAAWPFGRTTLPFIRAHVERYIDPAEWRKALQAERLALWRAEPKRAFDWETIHQTVASRFGFPAPPLLSLLAAQHPIDRQLLYPETPQVLAALRQAGFRLALATNGFLDYQKHAIERFAWQFDVVLAPDLIGLAKPQPGFLHSLRPGHQPVVHIGDRLCDDVVVANLDGAVAVWIWREMPQQLQEITVLERAQAIDPATIHECLMAELTQDGFISEIAQWLQPKPDVIIADLRELLDPVVQVALLSASR
jgi:FMN phosphatase YigB (HAD superfamily)